MRVFLTGATGFIGSAIVPELIQAGHKVIALARSEAGAKSLIAAGAQAHRGDLEDLDSLRSGAAESDGVIHAGFIHDFSRIQEVCQVDRRAIETLGEVLAGSNRPLIVTSGTALVASSRLATEDDVRSSGSTIPRVSEETAAAFATRGVRVSVVRLPPSVHGDGDHGFVPRLIAVAREKRISAYIGDGLNRWPAVHRLDAAHLYRLVLEKAPAGATFHGVADEGVAFRQIAETIARHLNIPIASKSLQEAPDHFGWIGHFAAIDNPASSARTQQQLSWRPKFPGLIADMDRGEYFKF